MSYMKTIVEDEKGYGKISSNITFFSGSWFGEVMTVQNASEEGVYYYGLFKTSNKGFCLYMMEKLI